MILKSFLVERFDFSNYSKDWQIDKISLSCFHNKRYALDDGILTLAYSHKDSVTSCKQI